MNRFIYLAGPIVDCTEGEAKDWRDYVCGLLPLGVVGVSPLRCEAPTFGGYMRDKMDPSSIWNQPKSINAKNWYDTVQADLVFAYLPKVFNDRRPSIGTLFEIGWAIALRKMIVLVTDDLYLAAHPLIETNVSFIVPTLEEGVEIIKGLLPIYTGNSESVSKTPRKGHRGHINRLGTSYTQGEDGIFQDNRERK
tara:strand:- start:1102 stop:1683 length:582 start_codon:yes stop_codon:yes gene_type:complete